jgi:hypothetical protein
MTTVKAFLCHFNFQTRQFLPVVKIYESLNFQFAHLTWTKELIFISEEKPSATSDVSMFRLLIKEGESWKRHYWP